MLANSSALCNTPFEIQHNRPGTFVITPLDLADDNTLSDAAFRLYIILKSYIYNPNAPRCWPSKTTLATRMGLTPRRIVDLLRELETREIIAIESRAPQGQTNVYHLVPRQERDAENCIPPVKKTAPLPMQLIAPELDHRESDQKEVDHTHVLETRTEEGVHAPVCEETHPKEISTIVIPESSAQARYDHDTFEVGYVARSPRQIRGRSAHRRSQHTQLKASQTAPESAGHASMSQPSQHTHAPLGAPLTPAQDVHDAIQTEIARQLAEYGIWPKRAALLAAQARSAGRDLNDIRAMREAANTAHDPAALLATMIANNALPPTLRRTDAPPVAEKYTTGKYAHIFNRPPATNRDEV